MRRVSILTLCVVAVLAACGGRSRMSGFATTTIYHPNRVSPQGATIVVRDPRTEQSHGLGPGTLQDAAQIVAYDPGRLCVRMSLWALADDLHRGDFERYDFTLSASDQVFVHEARGRRARRAPVVEGRIRPLGHLQVLGAQESVLAGRETVMVPDGVRDQCLFRDEYGYCRQWDTRLTHRGVQVDANVRVRSYSADLCFANQGLVTDSTRAIVLEMRERRQARQFVWEIDPSVPQQVQPPVAPPVDPQPAMQSAAPDPVPEPQDFTVQAI